MTKTVETWKNYNPFIRSSRIGSMNRQNSKSSHENKTPLSWTKSRNRPASKFRYFHNLSQLGMIDFHNSMGQHELKSRDKSHQRLSPYVKGNNETDRECSNFDVFIDFTILYSVQMIELRGLVKI